MNPAAPMIPVTVPLTALRGAAALLVAVGVVGCGGTSAAPGADASTVAPNGSELDAGVAETSTAEAGVTGLTGDTDLDELVTRYLGGFTTAKQSKETKGEFDHVNYFACRITMLDATERPVQDGRVFLYEQRNFGTRKVHYQRIIAVGRVPDGRIDTAIHRTTDDARLLGTCRKPAEERVLRTSDMADEKCDQLYVRDGEKFMGDTPPEGCATNWNGATSIKSKVIHFGTVIHVWGRFYDAKGAQVGGVGEVPYIYERFPEGETNMAY